MVPRVKHPIPPNQWTEFKQELCATCWAGCCHRMPVQVGVADLVRMELLTEEEAALNLEAVIEVLRAEGVLKAESPEDWVWVLEQQPSGDCLFLGADRRCEIYEQRPTICREFPAIGPRPGHCPYREKA